ncbi:MAG: HD domain-containing protein [Rhodothermaceae bacterium]|nr:HD domain-containing protein [Rhodothermaceae bacterium]
MTADRLFSPLVEHAIEIAAQWHDQTYRKGRWRDEPFESPLEEILHVPVMAHITAVALTVQRAGWEDEVVAAAFLHDVLEDHNRFRRGMRAAELEILVGTAVVDLVQAVSEPKRNDQGDWLPWRLRKEIYVETLATASPGAAAISLADKLHNAWSMTQSLEGGIDIFSDAPGRRGLSAGPAEQRWFFQAVLATTERHSDPRLVPMRTRLREEIGRFAALTEEG